ncbi:FAD-dependent oxidoreductase [Streptomyces sp. NPDC001717]|uniref:FAD-dependent oxidoreductase n=1 Tax=Streptomyces sp. NPDC001717 TaxID=3364604 RepID=UPI0036BF373D
MVLGAGIAGLPAARVLADRFARVTLVEKDEPAEAAPSFRPGIPQSRHVHVPWSRGVRLIEDLLPGATEKLRARVDRPAEQPQGLPLAEPRRLVRRGRRLRNPPGEPRIARLDVTPRGAVARTDPAARRQPGHRARRRAGRALGDRRGIGRSPPARTCATPARKARRRTGPPRSSRATWRG